MSKAILCLADSDAVVYYFSSRALSITDSLLQSLNMDMSLPVANATAAVLARVTAAFNAPLARAVVFGVHIDGKPFLFIN
jgi:hypothetical protein